MWSFSGSLCERKSPRRRLPNLRGRKMGSLLALINPEINSRIIGGLDSEISGKLEFLDIRDNTAQPFSLLSHPDIAGTSCGRVFFHHPFLDKEIIGKLVSWGIRPVCGNSVLEGIYPRDAAYNCLMMPGRFLLHRLDITDKSIMSFAQQEHMDMRQVRQGYTRCSVVPVSSHAFITEDCGIARCLENNGDRVCLVTKGHVHLKGYPYGFIGGASAVYQDKVFFFGSLEHHPDSQAISAFIASQGKTAVSLLHAPLEDFGGIHFWESE